MNIIIDIFKSLRNWVNAQKLNRFIKALIYLSVFIFILLVNDTFRFTHTIIKSNKYSTIENLARIKNQLNNDTILVKYIDNEILNEINNESYFEKTQSFLSNSESNHLHKRNPDTINNENKKSNIFNSTQDIDNIIFILTSSILFIIINLFCFFGLPFFMDNGSMKKNIAQSIGIGISVTLLISAYNYILFLFPKFTNFNPLLYYTFNIIIQISLIFIILKSEKKEKKATT